MEEILGNDLPYRLRMRIYLHISLCRLVLRVACDFWQTRIRLQIIKPGVLRSMSWKAVTFVDQRYHRCFMSFDKVNARYCSSLITSDRICRPRNKHYGSVAFSLRSISDDGKDAGTRSCLCTPMVSTGTIVRSIDDFQPRSCMLGKTAFSLSRLIGTSYFLLSHCIFNIPWSC